MTGLQSNGTPPRRHGAVRAIRRAALCVALLALFPAISDASVIGPVIGSVANSRAVTPPSRQPPEPTGRQLLKAQNYARNAGLKNLRQLRGYFDEVAGNRERIIARAARLLQSLAALGDGADGTEASRRVAAVASLAMRAGRRSDIFFDCGYRLPRGAVGWDFGAEGAPVHTGFIPVAPDAVILKEGMPPGAAAIAGNSALSDGIDGIDGIDSFETSLPNGLYRILIITEAAVGIGDVPFAEGIAINGAPLRLAETSRDSAQAPGHQPDGKLVLAEPLRQTALGLGIEGWAIVENGRLRIDFLGRQGMRAIAAIIAEPFDLYKLALDPRILEILSDALLDLAPAAGPIPAPPRRRGAVLPRGVSSPPARIAAAPAWTGRPPPFFAAPRGPRPLPAAPTAVAATPEPQILLNRGGSLGADSPGLAIDLWAMLDEASQTGVFLCADLPCTTEVFTPITEAPDLSAAARALGDWLKDPENLPDGWSDIQSVFDDGTAGSEIAVIYVFDTDAEILTDVELRINNDDSLLVWIDGRFVFGATGPGGGPDFSPLVRLPDLIGGRHTFQIIAESRGTDSPALSFELRGTPSGNPAIVSVATPVSEPGSLALFGLGVAGLLTLRCRARAKR